MESSAEAAARAATAAAAEPLPTSDAPGALRGFEEYRHALQPRCACFWSLFHAIDPVAMRIEPLMRPAPREGGWPADEPCRVPRARLLPKSIAPSKALLEMLVLAAATRRRQLDRRIDWLLPRNSSWVSDNLFALPAHSAYWTSEDAVLFIVTQLCAPIGEWLEDRARLRALGAPSPLPSPRAAMLSSAAMLNSGGTEEGAGSGSFLGALQLPGVSLNTLAASGVSENFRGLQTVTERAVMVTEKAVELPDGSEFIEGAALQRLLPPGRASFDLTQPAQLCCRMGLLDNLTGNLNQNLVVCQDGLLRLFEPHVDSLVSRKGCIDLRDADVSVGSESTTASSTSFGYSGYGGAPWAVSFLVHTRGRTYEMACASVADADAWFSACKAVQATWRVRREKELQELRDKYFETPPAADGSEEDSSGAESWAKARVALALEDKSTEGESQQPLGSGGWADSFFGVKKSGWLRKRGNPSSVLVAVSWATRWFCLSHDKCAVLAVRVADGRGTTTLLRANTPADFEKWAPLANARVPTASLRTRARSLEPSGGAYEGTTSATASALTMSIGDVAGSASLAALAAFASRENGSVDSVGRLAFGGGSPVISVDGYKVLTGEKGKQFVVFIVRVVRADGKTHMANRRFNEVKDLHRHLLAATPAGVEPPPAAPHTNYWNRFEPAYLQEKGLRLAEYLNRLCARCFRDEESAVTDAWAEPLLSFLAMPCEGGAPASATRTSDGGETVASESDATDAS
mmetsp:Transcript_661/g.1819  ORF Transcript_661/g.1819 Transcript_661/m.1819 type:complete len:746 (+) Transcript_661:1753-3990(+)